MASAPERRPLVDRLAAALSPAWAAQREVSRLRAERARAALGMFADLRRRAEQRREFYGSSEVRRFDAAAQTARTQGWVAPLTAPDATGATLLANLVKRSRDLSRNNKWAAKAKRAVPTHMVGDGVRLVVEHDRDAERRVAQELFDQWAEEDADADGRTDLYGLQRLVAAEVVEAGEVLARMRLRRQTDGLTVPLQVQVLESEYLDATQDSVFGVLEGGRLRRLGVEFDQRGRRLGYWVWAQHPGVGAWSLESMFVPAAGMLHVYRVDRAGQVRGVPWGAPCILDLRDLGDWGDATMVRVKLAACFAGFVSTPFEDVGSAMQSATGRNVEELEPGLVQRLNPGETVTLTNPPGVEGMEDFPKLTLRGIAVGYGLPYHVLAGDLSDVNFSSARIGNLDWDRELAAWRSDWFVPQFLRGVWAAWRSQAELAGLIAPGCRMSWTPPARGMIEPKVDAEAAVARIRGGLSTLSEEQRATGWRPEDLMAEQAADWERARELGISLDSDPNRAAQGQASAAAPAPPA